MKNNMKKLKMPLSFLCFIIITSTLPLIIGAPDENYSRPFISRYASFTDVTGGEWHDDFSNNDFIEMSVGVENKAGIISPLTYEELPLFEEDFEEYSDGQNLFGFNGWMEDSSRSLSTDLAEFTASSSGPTPMPSSFIGKVYNPSSGYSWVLSEKLSVSSGILECWFAVDNIFSGSTGSMSLSLSLLKSDSDMPETTDRVISILIRDGGIGYRLDPASQSEMFITSGISANTWYKVEIKFNCTISKADYFVFNRNGNLIGKALSTSFISSTSLIKRIELTTSKDHSGTIVTTFWDDIRIMPITMIEDLPYLTQYQESFEKYSEGQNIFGLNGWIEDDSRSQSSNQAQFTATISAPNPKPSDMVGKIYNPSTGYSWVLSEKFDVSEGMIESWFAVDQVFFGATGSMSLTLSLLKSDSEKPETMDRVVSILIRDGGLGYRLDPITNSEMFIPSGITKNTWYKTEIWFDCNKGKADIYIYDSDLDLIGAALDTDFISPTSSVKRIELTTQREKSGSYTTTYWDDIRLWGIPENPFVLTNVVELLDDQKWSTLYIEKEITQTSWIESHILSQDNVDISDLEFDQSSYEIDLRPLNTFDIFSIKILFKFVSSGEPNSKLIGWGFEWNSTNSWRDSFTTSIKASSYESTKSSDGNVSLQQGKSFGIYQTEKIQLPRNHYWYGLKADILSGASGSIILELVDMDSGNPISPTHNIEELGVNTWNISNIDPVSTINISIRITFDNNSGSNPVLGSLSLSWKENRLPSLGSIKFPDQVNRGNSTKISIKVIDPDQASSSLVVILSYRHNSSHIWETENILNPSYGEDTNEWEFAFNPPFSSQIGEYFFRLEYNDIFNTVISYDIENPIYVLNNPPLPPEIILVPSDPDQNDNISIVFSNYGMDLESSVLLYDIKWLINEIPITEQSRFNISYENLPRLSSEYTSKHDSIKCGIRTFDGIDHSEYSFAQVQVKNSEPAVSSIFEGEITFLEDHEYFSRSLFDMFLDVDNDDLTFSYSENSFVHIDILDNGSMYITPEEDWFGEDHLKLFISDGVSHLEKNITIIVEPVNDPPQFVSFRCDREYGFTREPFNFTIEAIDIDTSSLSFTWWINNEQILQDQSTLSVNWTFDIWTDAQWRGNVTEKLMTVSVFILDEDYKIGPFHKNVTISLRDEEKYQGETPPPSVSREEDNYLLWAIIISITIFSLITIIGVSILIMYRKKISDSEHELMMLESDKDVKEEVRCSGTGDDFASSLVTGAPLQAPLSPIISSYRIPNIIVDCSLDEREVPLAPMPMKEALPPVKATPSIIEGERNYLRPDMNRQSREYPSEDTSIKDDQLDININDSQSNQENLKSEFHQEDRKIWSPEMVESRTSNEAKSAIQLLSELNELRERGAITQEEYEMSKKRLLRKI